MIFIPVHGRCIKWYNYENNLLNLTNEIVVHDSQVINNIFAACRTDCPRIRNNVITVRSFIFIYYIIILIAKNDVL